MSIVSNSILLATDITTLKTEIKNEMLRRQYVGSVAEYGGTSYDYAVSPAENGAVLIEHYNKNQAPLAAVNADTVPSAATSGTPITYSDINALQAEATLLKAKGQYASTQGGTGCKSSCTGLCYTSCSGSCSESCQGSCVGSCGGCDGSCLTTCALFCGSGCGNNCTGCSGTCSGGCSSTCTGNCTGSCTGTCKTGCSGSCRMECSCSSNGAGIIAG